MLKTLRSQLILSHILPSLIIIPLMGIALVYFLENRVILPSIKNELVDDAVVIAKFAQAQPNMFGDSHLSQSLLDGISIDSETRVMIFSADGALLASSEEADEPFLNQKLDLPGLSEALGGKVSEQVDFNQNLHGNVIDVYAPVMGESGPVLGVIRVSYHYMTVVDQLVDLRYLILVILAFGALFSAVLGYVLALSISRPVKSVSEAIFDLARGDRADELAEEGAEEIKSLQRSANFLFSRLRSLERSRRHLLANLVHELGRPLGGLHVGIQVLRGGGKDEPEVLEELLEGMENETSILRRLLNDLSHLYDSVLGPLELKREPVALSKWLPRAIHSGKEAARMKGIQWRAEFPEDLPSLILDSHRMDQAIGNLVANAIKYTPSGGQVSVSAGVSEQRVWIRVSDTGPGIPEAEITNIFTPFFRGSQQKRIKQGMGLGLSIAQDLVVAHAGTLEVESELGKGSQFTIWLPLERAYMV